MAPNSSVRALFHNCGVQSRMCQSRVKARSTQLGEALVLLKRSPYACGLVDMCEGRPLFSTFISSSTSAERAPVWAGWADKQLFLETQELTWEGSSTEKRWGFWLLFYTSIFSVMLKITNKSRRLFCWPDMFRNSSPASSWPAWSSPPQHQLHRMEARLERHKSAL